MSKNFRELVKLLGPKAGKILIARMGGRAVKVPKKFDCAREKYLFNRAQLDAMPPKLVCYLLGITRRYYKKLRALPREVPEQVEPK